MNNILSEKDNGEKSSVTSAHRSQNSQKFSDKSSIA